jgi:hypothetical protein
MRAKSPWSKSSNCPTSWAAPWWAWVWWAPDLTLTADEVTLRNQTTQYDFGKNYTGLVANTSYTFSVWVKLGINDGLATLIDQRVFMV